MKILKVCAFVGVFILLNNCNEKPPHSDIPIINIEDHVGHYQKVYLSEIVSNIEYIQLQTSENCLIDDIKSIHAVEDFIFVTGFKYCHCFDLQGKFIRTIGKTGRGPGEYDGILAISFDRQFIYINSSREIHKYSLDGKYQYSIHIPLIEDQPLNCCTNIGNDAFLGHHFNYTGNAAFNYYIFNEKGDILKKFPNYIQFKRKWGWNTGETMIEPYTEDSVLFVKEYHNDTLFRLSKNTIKPEYVFRLGKYSVPAELREQERIDLSEYPYIHIPAIRTPMTGTPQYIFFSSFFGNTLPFPNGKRNVHFQGRDYEIDFGRFVLGIYDKQNKSTKLLDIEPVSKMAGIVNDIDGGLPFWPKLYTKGKLMDVWQAEDMKEILTEEYFAKQTVKDPQAHQKLRNLLEKLKEDDNPVVVIAK